MDLISHRRQHIIWAISQNPVTITIKRTERIKENKQYSEQVTYLGPYTVRIFQRQSLVPYEMTTVAGEKRSERGWGLLADYKADLKAGINVRDEFEVGGLGKFFVSAVYPQIVQGQITGYQADIEKIG